MVLEQGAAPRQQAATYQRVSALNLASQRLLSHIGAWPAIASSAAAYSQMQVWDADSFARIAFDAQTEGVAALGHICRLPPQGGRNGLPAPECRRQAGLQELLRKSSTHAASLILHFLFN